jgi:hypothetical protein
MLLKTEGLTQEQLSTALAPSSLTFGGLLNHLRLVEDTWMQVRFLGLPDREPWVGVDWDADPNWEFHAAAAIHPAELRARYREACARSRLATAGASSLDQMSAMPRRDGRDFSLRWVLFHLIKETARHADLLREAIDGLVGE